MNSTEIAINHAPAKSLNYDAKKSKRILKSLLSFIYHQKMNVRDRFQGWKK